MVQSSRSVPLQLALRLLRSPASFNAKVKIWLGQLPDELPIEIPLLDHALVIASRQQKHNSAILLQIPQSALWVQTVYSNRLRAIGWLQCYSDAEAIDFNLFTSTRPPASLPKRLTFFYHPLSLTLVIETRSMQENLTQVRLSLDRSINDSLDSAGQQEWAHSPFNLLPLPQLMPPPDSEIPPSMANLPSSRSIANRGRGGGGSNIDWYSKSNLQTSLSGSALMAHYDAQLEQVGWTRQAGEAPDRSLWSVWTLRDRQNQLLQLLLSFVADGDFPDHYAASLCLLNLNHIDQIMLPASAPATDSALSISEDVVRQFLADDFSASAEAKQFWVGQLPPKFPDAIVLPTQTEVLGSLSEESEGDRTTVFLIAPLTPDQFWQHLTEPLLRAGWQILRPDTRPKDLGFVATERPWQSDGFISPTGDECYLSLETVERNCFDVALRWNSRTVDQLNQELAAKIANLPNFTLQSPEQTEDEPAAAAIPLWSNTFPAPTLRLPEQTEVFQRTTGDSNEELRFCADITTSLSAAALVNPYQVEMQQAGWQLQATSQRETCYFSLWSLTVQGRSWQGTLSLLAHPERRDRFTASLNIQPLQASI